MSDVPSASSTQSTFLITPKLFKRLGTTVLFFMALALLFSGCQPVGQDSPTNDIKLGSTNSTSPMAVNSNSLETDTEGRSTSQTYQLSDQKTTTNQINTEGEKMKQLSDFKEIIATQATLHTTKGDVVIELYRTETPVTTANFLELADEGFYNGIRFHRIIADFMAQVGDPLSKDLNQQARWGTGGPGYVIPDEFSDSLKHDGPGVVSMANRGPNTGGSQFFITYEATPWLDGKHTVFGKVTSGMEVVEKLEIGDAIESVTLE